MFIFRLFFFVALETAALLFLLATLTIQRIYRSIRVAFDAKKQKWLSDTIFDFIGKGKEPSLFPRVSPSRLLPALEAYGVKIKGADWVLFIEQVSQKYLLPKARRWAKSLFWMRRNFAARVFALAPLSIDEPIIAALADDSHFLVRGIATLAALQLGSEAGILLALKWLGQEKGYAHFFYLDLFKSASNQALECVARAVANPQLRIAALEALGGKTLPFPLPFLHDCLTQADPRTRKLALTILLSNPAVGSASLWLKLFKDLDEEVRSIAGEGVIRFVDRPPLEEIKTLFLQSSSMKERVRAAVLLKRLGALDLEEYKQDKEAHALAVYAMEFE